MPIHPPFPRENPHGPSGAPCAVCGRPVTERNDWSLTRDGAFRHRACSEGEQCAYEDGMVTYTRCVRPVAKLGKYYCIQHAQYEPQECEECGSLDPCECADA